MEGEATAEMGFRRHLQLKAPEQRSETGNSEFGKAICLILTYTGFELQRSSEANGRRRSTEGGIVKGAPFEVRIKESESKVCRRSVKMINR